MIIKDWKRKSMRLFKIKYNSSSKLVTEILSQHESNVGIQSQKPAEHESCKSRKESLHQSQNTFTFSTMHSLSEPECGHCKATCQTEMYRM